MIREGLLQGLERLDALELKVRRAEALAVLGDRLLKCIAMDQGKGKEACHVLEKEWQQTLQQ